MCQATQQKFSMEWAELLRSALTEPGRLMAAYSLGNQLAAYEQCMRRGIEPGPINTFNGWRGLGRNVKRGERALWLCMPLTVKRKVADGESDEFIKAFVWKPRWFVLSQTDGAAYEMPAIPEWDKRRALEALDITEERFAALDGNLQGYAIKRLPVNRNRNVIFVDVISRACSTRPPSRRE